MKEQISEQNVFGEALEPCSFEPMTGFYRDGFCRCDPKDLGKHIVCAIMTKEFLDFSLAKGNDLTSAKPELGFEGLEPGDLWCLCALRWQEAFEAGKAPKVKLASTHIKALEVLSLSDLKQHAQDLM